MDKLSLVRQTIIQFITTDDPEIFDHIDPRELKNSAEMWSLSLLLAYQEAGLGLSPKYDEEGERLWPRILIEAAYVHFGYRDPLDVCPAEVRAGAGVVEVINAEGYVRGYRAPPVRGPVPEFHALAA